MFPKMRLTIPVEQSADHQPYQMACLNSLVSLLDSQFHADFEESRRIVEISAKIGPRSGS